MPVSKLLLPLSYVAIMGGTFTLIGTSTNFVVDGLLQKGVGISLVG
jgi:di/tricarboxylate transporter